MQHALTFVIATLCILVICYRLYGVFFVKKVLKADDSEVTPSHLLEDGKDYVPTKKWVNFGSHFAAIAAAGPLVGPVLAAQYGYLPSILWLLIGCVIGGAVHDTVVLFASMKHSGKSLSEVAKTELGPIAGWCTGLAMLFIITITMAGLSMVVVHALERNPWGTFAVFMTIPVAIGVGLWEHFTGNMRGATWVGIITIMACVIVGPYIQTSTFGEWLSLRTSTVSLVLPIYAFFATALPVWMLLTPRGYLSSFMKIGVFGALVVGVIFINPEIQFPAVTEFIHGNGPVLAGPVWPFISITIACGAISGFHAFIGSGTTPKQIDKWSDILPVGFGAMLAECVVGVMALIAATSLYPADYFAINSSPEVFATLGMDVIHLPQLSQEIGLDLYGRTGGAVTLAVGMADIFTRIPWFSQLASYFFQFVVMFEAVFILTAVDSGTRVARYLLQDFLGDIWAPLKRINWLPGSIGCSIVACLLWGYLLNSGDINSVWALFGVSNQLMASIGLMIGATIILRLSEKRWYMLTCLIPLAYLYVTVNYAAYWMVKNIYFNSATKGFNIFNGTISIVMVILGIVIMVSSIIQWLKLWRTRSAGNPVEALSN
ncbi:MULTISPECIES: carbon starvation CstA family protein [Photorhabdus]|uniref:Carbon starvation protein A n=1 Tax=Photorhabdus kayaii TaxID=230088 RepID=A0ABX0B039_9GAMM|nr:MULTISPECIES: carbon starvation protein A [Photorhabdus]MCC8372814.1 carbon starvation protein A [Photorhabdus bodei]MCT8351329.1 carbon starvation protein A [Photorhabdus kayaii]NDL11547.1 carbon starvation protein A [Photorhabdus kayaii]NDL25180.1 carbon starvation protein A [Photorhabdus kayaii]RAX10613.1 carbon starvation protein A [Photorhabdus sp. HUG-39]